MSFIFKRLSDRNPACREGFTILELAIVVGVVGLLIGGVLAGREVVHAAELRHVAMEMDQYAQGAKAFEQKYNGIPGDLANATQYWGVDDAHCHGEAGIVKADGVCNGNGDGQLNPPNGVPPWNVGMNGTAEHYQFWRHMMKAGLIEGSKFTGIAGPNDSQGWGVVPGVNAPVSKYESGAWGVQNSDDVIHNPHAVPMFRLNYGNAFRFGTGPAATSGVFSRTDAQSLDDKMDDGKPASGKVIATWQGCTTAASDSDTQANYSKEPTDRQQGVTPGSTQSSTPCTFYFRNQF